MYVADPNLTLPPDDTTLWRYQTFDKFVQFLDSGTLWFARADNFSDRFEAAIPVLDLPAAREGMLAGMREWGAQSGVQTWLRRFGGFTYDELAAMPDDQLATVMPKFANRFSYVSCWNRNDSESAGLWSEYTGGGNGVAVRTTVGALRDVLDEGSGDYRMTLGEVHYLNYHKESWGEWHTNSSVYHKRRAFAYEEEVRAVIAWPHYEQLADGSVDMANVPDVAGVAIPVDLHRLVHSVVVSAGSTGWFPGVVASVMRKYGLSGVPVRSELAEEPIW